MTDQELLDHYAGLAMQTLIRNIGYSSADPQAEETIADLAWRMALEMLAGRQAPPASPP